MRPDLPLLTLIRPCLPAPHLQGGVCLPVLVRARSHSCGPVLILAHLRCGLACDSLHLHAQSGPLPMLICARLCLCSRGLV
jgi:hypothetical protein